MFIFPETQIASNLAYNIHVKQFLNITLSIPIALYTYKLVESHMP